MSLSSLFNLIALVVTLAAVFGWVNHKWFRLPHTIGLVVIALGVSFAGLLVDALVPALGLQGMVRATLTDIDFHDTLMTGMLGFLLFAGALHVDLDHLLSRRSAIATLATVGILLSTGLVAVAAYFLTGLTGLDVPFAYCLVFGALISPTDPIAVLDELLRIATMLFPLPPHTDPFWTESARTGFVGVGAYLAETPDRPFSLGALYGELTRGDPRTRFPALIHERAEAGRPLSSGCARALGDFCASSDNTFAGVRQTLTSRLNLWINPRVVVATEASDFDLASLRARRATIYLATSPDNLSRVAPLYSLLFQQLLDRSCRDRPDPKAHPHQVLVLLDEFARLGHAEVVAKGFAYVAGYGLRLLPVLQSPAQLRAEYGPDVTEEILANCAVEIAFAPKELRLANDLSERLGFTTVRSPSRSRPTGLSRGHRSVSESDQRRALLLPQELMQLPPEELLVLRAGLPAIRGRKIRHYRDAAFRHRRLPAPDVPRLAPSPVADEPLEASPPTATSPPLTLEALAPMLDAGGYEPAPPEGASPAEIEAWAVRFIDAAAQHSLEGRTDVGEPTQHR